MNKDTDPNSPKKLPNAQKNSLTRESALAEATFECADRIVFRCIKGPSTSSMEFTAKHPNSHMVVGHAPESSAGHWLWTLFHNEVPGQLVGAQLIYFEASIPENSVPKPGTVLVIPHTPPLFGRGARLSPCINMFWGFPSTAHYTNPTQDIPDPMQYIGLQVDGSMVTLVKEHPSLGVDQHLFRKRYLQHAEGCHDTILYQRNS